MRDLPGYIPPGVRYVIDISDIGIEILPPGFTMPAVKSATSLDMQVPADDPANPEAQDKQYRRRGAVTVRAELRPLATIPAADGTINAGDYTLTIIDPWSRLYRLELASPRASWATTLASGAGDSFSIALGLVTLNNVAGVFTVAMIGHLITITGSTSPANDGTFLVRDQPSSTKIRYVNVNAVAEAFAGNWSVSQSNLKGAIFAASNPSGEHDAIIFDSTNTTLWLTLSDRSGSRPAASIRPPYVIKEQSASLFGHSANDGTGGGSLNVFNLNSFAWNGIKFNNYTTTPATGVAEACMGVRAPNALYSFSYCDFASLVIFQGGAQYRQIYEVCYFHGDEGGGARIEMGGATPTINSCFFNGVTNWGTTPGSGYIAMSDSVCERFTFPLGDTRPLSAGNFNPPTAQVGGGLDLYTKYVWSRNNKTHAILLRGSGALEFTRADSSPGDSIRVERPMGPIALTNVRAENPGSGIALNLVSDARVTFNDLSSLLGGVGAGQGDYKVGGNPAATTGVAGESFAALVAENDCVPFLPPKAFNADAGADDFACPAHGFASGDGPMRIDAAFTPELSTTTDYWIIRTGIDRFQLAASRSEALAGAIIPFTVNGASTIRTRPSTSCTLAKA